MKRILIAALCALGYSTGINAAQPSAYELVNQLREAAGLRPLATDGRLAEAALGHARYLVANQSAEHDQEANGSHFTGHRPAQRAVAAGYQLRLVSENLSKGDDRVHGSLRGLMAAIYHRFGFLDPSVTHQGIGIDGEGTDTAMVYLMGNNAIETLCRQPAPKVAGRFVLNACADDRMILEEDYLTASEEPALLVDKLIVWPPAGAMNIPPAFYEESPDPIPDLSFSGYPISVQVNTSQVKEHELLAFSLRDLETGRILKPVRIITPETDLHQKFEKGQYALFPLERLRWGGRYEAFVSMSLDHEPYELRWQFETTHLNPRPFTIAGQNERLSMISGEPIHLVIETDPEGPVLADLRYRHAQDVRAQVDRPDANTLRVQAYGPAGRTIRFYSENGPHFELLIRQY